MPASLGRMEWNAKQFDGRSVRLVMLSADKILNVRVFANGLVLYKGGDILELSWLL